MTHVKLKKDGGFTLIELVIVLTIIGIIMSIAVPGFTKNLASAKLQADKASARTIGIAVQMAQMDGIETITIDELVKEKYLEKKPEPQNKKHGEFELKISGDRITVYYKGDTTSNLYDNEDSEKINDSN